MSSTVRDAEYDANLLASAPQATKEQLQSGYTTDLLKPKSKQRRVRDLEAGQVNQKKTRPAATTESSPAPSKIAPAPFYRTRKGIIVISIVVIVVLGAIIGGAVGGTQGKKVHASTVPGGQSGAFQSVTPTPSPSRDPGTVQTPVLSAHDDLSTPASQEVGSPA